jgi:ACS family hexuronate transporter-like MFS transporter
MLRLRWIAVLIFVFSAVLNYLDRQVLATMVDIWRAHPEFPFDYSRYGELLAAFSIAYALSAPFMGWFLDRVGLTRGICISVAVWAVASFGTARVHSFEELLWWRALLGAAEASGVSAMGKVSGGYLLPEERALGAATQQLGLSIGAGLAPRFAVFFAYGYSWRWAFAGAGALSLAWIPVWILTERLIPPSVQPATERSAAGVVRELLRDSRLWALMAANALGMTVYSLWTNWAPTYLIRTYHLTPPQAASYTWLIPLSAYFGAFAGGSLSFWWIRRGVAPVAARRRACLVSATAALVTAALPWASTAALATAGISASFFLVTAWSTNLYTIPVDLYGAGRAAFGVSALVFAYGAMQAVVSRPLGVIIERFGFTPVTLVVAFLPLLSCGLLYGWRGSE